ncbi:MAG TPA: ribonuclease R [bacterium]|nr:ribonuclease R [bacterium]
MAGRGRGFKKGDRGARKPSGRGKAGRGSGGFARSGKKAGGAEPGGYSGGVYRGRRPVGTRGRVRSDAGLKITGTLEGHARGFGFVRPDQEGMADVFIPASYMGGALHGDRVEALAHAEGRGGKGWGEIVKVVERSASPIVGYFNGQMVVPRDARIGAWLKVHPADAGDAAAGEMVLAQVVKTGPHGVQGRIVEVLGPSDEPGIESRIALRAHGFEEEHSAEAGEEAGSAPQKVTAADRAGREDLRNLFTITIDPETARDFDDAVSIERTDGGYRLWVSIADVSHYVKRGGAIDAEAYERATSVYFPDRAIHMLPSELSAGICSLKPGVDRLAMTVEMNFDGRGRRLESRMYGSVINSDHRLSYDQVEEMEHDSGLRERPPGAWPAIQIMRELALLRRERRAERGAIDLDVPEPVVVLDPDGEVSAILRSEQTWSHKLIEEFMLAANETVASFLTERGQPMVYRIHEPPAPPAVTALAEMLAPLGFRLLEKGAEPEHIRPRDYQLVINKARGTPYEMMVKVMCLRSMMQAEYSAELRGHFGLAADRYCHFTSPIRRYPDLIVHRILKQFLSMGGTGFQPGSSDIAATSRRKGSGATGHKPVEPSGGGSLKGAAAHCSERERAAQDAEREMVDYYRARWMARHLGEGFGGVISGVAAFGLFVELDQAFVEGMVPADTLDPDLEFHEKEMAVRGGHSGLEFRIGDRVRVQAVAVDLEQRKISFRLLEKG